MYLPPRFFALFVGILLLATGCKNNLERSDSEFRVVTWNVLWLFDDDLSDVHEDESMPSRAWSAPSRDEYQWKLEKIAQAILVLDADIVALQEIENENVLSDLAARLRSSGEVYYPSFREGRDTFTQQDVGILSRWIPVDVSLIDDKAAFRSVLTPTKHLVVRYELPDGSPLTVIGLHLPARSSDRRKEMAESVSRFIREMNRESPVIVLGDLNTQVTYDQVLFPAETEIGILQGQSSVQVTDDLVDVHSYFKINTSTHRSRGSQFDRILVDRRFIERGLPWQLYDAEVLPELSIVGRRDPGDWNNGAYWKIPQRQRDVSDHYPVLAVFRKSLLEEAKNLQDQ